jgi:hypothetical protein
MTLEVKPLKVVAGPIAPACLTQFGGWVGHSLDSDLYRGVSLLWRHGTPPAGGLGFCTCGSLLSGSSSRMV